MAVPEELMEILVCLECKGRLDDRGAVLVCRDCGLHYPVRDDIPIMMIEEAYRPEEGSG